MRFTDRTNLVVLTTWNTIKSAVLKGVSNLHTIRRKLKDKKQNVKSKRPAGPEIKSQKGKPPRPKGVFLRQGVVLLLHEGTAPVLHAAIYDGHGHVAEEDSQGREEAPEERGSQPLQPAEV